MDYRVKGRMTHLPFQESYSIAFSVSYDSETVITSPSCVMMVQFLPFSPCSSSENTSVLLKVRLNVPSPSEKNSFTSTHSSENVSSAGASTSHCTVRRARTIRIMSKVRRMMRMTSRASCIVLDTFPCCWL